MVEQQKQRIELELSRRVDEIDRTILRKMQAEMHECAAKCCRDTGASMDSVHRCVENCSVPVQRAQQHVETELGNFNNRLQRCVMDCNDSIKDKMGPNPTDDDISKYTGMFERCAIKCVDKHVDLLPGLFKSMHQVLGNKRF
ncbi:protein FAM136A [Toxorhynchites rutilus septentrionalis]|uniref:protein FAM136A n=1 Tax=Toxorhynchites rutilus septentrionalis TaxID=329112 RepID=UPI00247A3ECC|nr:protein FAM136A [Toxorhynchites rutilus septentrionalis]